MLVESVVTSGTSLCISVNRCSTGKGLLHAKTGAELFDGY